jgi:putative transposase
MTRAVRSPAKGPDIEARQSPGTIAIKHIRPDLWTTVIDRNGKTLFVERPWLTVASNIHTGSVVAVVTSYEPPSIPTLMQCLKQIAQSEEQINAEPVDGMASSAWGRPRTLVIDAEYDQVGSSFQTACAAAGIDLVFQPSTNIRSSTI